MSYTPPAGNALELQFGTGYTPPAGNAVVLQFGEVGVPTGTIAAALTITGGFTAEYALPTFVGAIDATLSLSGEVTTSHGITGSFAALLDVDVDVQARHGVVGALASTLTLTGGMSGLHPRYTVHGQVKDGDTLVDRRVRVYKRSTGALVAEADTVGGVFDINVGWALDEFYIIPIDLDNGATDWAPPVANRVLSALVSD